VMDLLDSGFKVEGIYAEAGWIVANLAMIRDKGVPVFETLPREMERISALSTPSPVLAVVAIPKEIHSAHQYISTLSHQHISTLILALDDIRDPGNLGTIIRIADWFGISTMLCSENCVDVYNPKVIQASMGAILHVKVYYTGLAEFLTEATEKKIAVFGTMLEGDSVYSHGLGKKGIILLGNESKGISAELTPFVSDRIFIPGKGASKPGIDSLNVGMAASIVFSEFSRREG